MEVSFSPEMQAKLERLAAETGRPADELIRDAMAGYLDQIADARSTIDRRYDEIRSGKVKLIPGDEVIAHFREKIAARRAPQA